MTGKRLLARILMAGGATLLMFLSLSAWSLSSPVGSSPDEEFHLSSIWCGSGERDGLCQLGPKPEIRLVPDKALYSPCFAFNDEISGGCQGPDFQETGFTLVPTDRVNTGTQYPSGYYFTASFAAGENVAASTIAVRLVNSLIFSVLLVTTCLLLPRALRFSLVGSAALTLIPLGMFLIASVNPSSWATISGVLVVPTVLGLYVTSGRHRIGLGIVATLAVLLAVTSRGDSAIFASLGVLAASIFAFENRRQFWRVAALPAILFIAGVIGFLSTGQSALALDGSMGEAADGSDQKSSLFALIAMNLISLPNLWAGVFGQGWGLGWLDTGVPGLTSGLMIFLAAGVLFMAVRWPSWRKTLSLVGLGLSLIVIPSYILAQSNSIVGQNVQPRYVLPLISMFLAIAIAPSLSGRNRKDEGVSLSTAQTWLLVVGLSIAQSLALYSNLRRYVGASDVVLTQNIEWWWVAGPSPLAIMVLGSLSFAALTFFYFRPSIRNDFVANSSGESSGRAPRGVA